MAMADVHTYILTDKYNIKTITLNTPSSFGLADASLTLLHLAYLISFRKNNQGIQLNGLLSCLPIPTTVFMPHPNDSTFCFMPTVITVELAQDFLSCSSLN